MSSQRFLRKPMHNDSINAVHIAHQCENTSKLKSMCARLVACNGDCGSKIAKIIHQSVNGTVM